MSSSENLKLNSYDEWSSLQQVVVGRAENYIAHHYDISFRLLHGVFPMNDTTSQTLYFEAAPFIDTSGYIHSDIINIPLKIQEELIEDVESFATALSGQGISVLRPEPLTEVSEISSPFWKTYPIPALNIRDQVLILGDTIIETSPYVRARIFENDLLKPILYKYFNSGSPWLCMPRPSLSKNTFDNSYLLRRGQDVSAYVSSDPALEVANMPFEIIFDGAQCMRFGRDVIVNLSNEHHELAFRWLVQNMGHKFNFHAIRGFANNHLDSIVLPLRPGTLLLRSASYLDHLPKSLASWDTIIPPEVDQARFPNYDDKRFNIASKIGRAHV